MRKRYHKIYLIYKKDGKMERLNVKNWDHDRFERIEEKLGIKKKDISKLEMIAGDQSDTPQYEFINGKWEPKVFNGSAECVNCKSTIELSDVGIEGYVYCGCGAEIWYEF